MEPRRRDPGPRWYVSVWTLLLLFMLAAMIVVWFAFLRAAYRPVPPARPPREGVSKRAPARDKTLPPLPPASR